MLHAVAAGPGCVLWLGDSRMDAGYDPLAFQNALSGRSAGRCSIDLAIGATDISGSYLTAREYLARGGLPSLVVIGKVADTLLAPDQALDPQQMVGNNAIHLAWSHPADVFLEEPGFPSANLAAFDAGLRFLVAQATPAGRYQSLFSARVQALQNALIGRVSAGRNHWGAVEDMGGLEQEMRQRSSRQLAAANAAPVSDRLGRWFPLLVRLLKDRKIPFVVVELPMPTAFHRAVCEAPENQVYERWLSAELPRYGGALIDLSAEPWVSDELFVDPLHLGRQGASLLSAALGKRLSAIGALP
jgi:hypothetical protein